MYFADALTLDAPRRTKDGFLAVRARAARTGVYRYSGAEIDPDNKHGLRDKATVNVLRDEATVFDKAALHSFIGKPITDDHPAEAVTAKNWRDHARGTVMGAVRDGEYVAFDLLLTDAAAIAKVDGGKRELSNGYAADLEFGSFTAADGTVCEARQATIAGNHVALVGAGRAGSACRISDAAPCDALPILNLLDRSGEPTVKKITLDGLTVDLSDAAAVEAAINKLQTKLADANDAMGKTTAELEEEKKKSATKDGEIAALKSQLADAQDPAKLQAAADARAKLVADAKRMLPSLVTDGKSALEIKRAVVQAKLGDTAKDMADASIEGAFVALVPAQDAKPDPLRSSIADAMPRIVVTDTAHIRNAARAARYA